MPHALGTDSHGTPAVHVVVVDRDAPALAVTEPCGDVDDIHLLLPDVDHLQVVLTRHGPDHHNTVLAATPEPYGVTGATVVRDET